jgi:acyl carrier protein
LSDNTSKVRAFIIENFLFGNDEGLADDTSFLEEGIIDSTGVLELVNFLEEEFGITIDDEELIPENLDSINNVTAYLGKKLQNQTGLTGLT